MFITEVSQRLSNNKEFGLMILMRSGRVM